MTSPTSDFICLLGQDYLHFSDPLPHLPSVLLLLGEHSLPEAFAALAGQNGSLASDIKFSAESLLRAGVTNGFYLLLENEALSHPPAHKSPIPPNLAELNPKSKEQRSALRHHLFLSEYMSAPPVASVEENCELDELLGGNVWSSPHPPPASLLAFPG